jgi:hypothetical protein
VNPPLVALTLTFAPLLICFIVSECPFDRFGLLVSAAGCECLHAIRALGSEFDPLDASLCSTLVQLRFAEVPAWAYVVVAVLGCTASLFMMTKLATMEIVNGVIQLPRRYEVGLRCYLPCALAVVL